MDKQQGSKVKTPTVIRGRCFISVVWAVVSLGERNISNVSTFFYKINLNIIMKTLFFSIILWVFCISCDRINPKNEPFYCKINGKQFIPETDNSPIGGVGSTPLKVEWDKVNSWFYITALNTPNYVALIIKLPQNETIKVGEYLLGNDLKGTKASYSYNSSSPISEYVVSYSGKIIVTKVEGTLISGTFDFKTKSVKTNTEFDITEGQFNNLRY